LNYSYLFKTRTALERFIRTCKRTGWISALKAEKYKEADFFTIKIGEFWRGESRELPEMTDWSDITISEIIKIK